MVLLWNFMWNWLFFLPLYKAGLYWKKFSIEIDFEQVTSTFCLKSHNFLTLRKFSLFSALGIFSELRIFSKKFLKFSILLLASWIFLNIERFLGGQASQRFMLSYCQKQKARSNHWINQSRIDFLWGIRVSVLPVEEFFQ